MLPFAGKQAGFKLDGCTEVRPTPSCADLPAHRHWVVLRGKDALPSQTGVYSHWHTGAKLAVCCRKRGDSKRGYQVDTCVHHAFASLQEVDAYCSEAGVVRPELK